MPRSSLFVAATVCLVADAVGQPPLNNQDARLAVDAYHAAAQKAKEEYEAKLSDARRALLAKLEEAQKAATRAGNLDDALAVRDAAKKFAAEAPAAKGSADARLAADARKGIVGTWAMHYADGARQTFVFNEDGTASIVENKTPGMWFVETDRKRLVVHWQGKYWDAFALPLDPMGAKHESWAKPGSFRVNGKKQ